MRRDENIQKGKSILEYITSQLTAICAVNGEMKQDILKELMNVFGIQSIDFDHLKNTGEIVQQVTLFSIDAANFKDYVKLLETVEERKERDQ